MSKPRYPRVNVSLRQRDTENRETLLLFAGFCLGLAARPKYNIPAKPLREFRYRVLEVKTEEILDLCREWFTVTMEED